MELMELRRGDRFLDRFPSLYVVVGVALSIVADASPSHAQSASQPGFDPRQTERRFDTLDTEQQRKNAKSLPPMPGLGQQTGTYDSKPSFALRAISVIGA